MKILFIGGTGTISTSCVSAALAAGHDISILCRGTRNERIPKGVTVLKGDAYQLEESLLSSITNTDWDCVVNWTIYNLAQARMDIERFSKNTKMYFFISSTSVYDNSNAQTPIIETQCYHNSKWFYSKSKIDVEIEFLHAFKNNQFPAVIIRPGHTYNDFTIPTNIQGLGYSLIKRIASQEDILIHENGQSYWTLTHSDDFANYFVQLFNNTGIIGETIHIATEEYHTWNDIFSIYADLVGKKINKVYLPSDEIFQRSHAIGEPILNDKKFDRIFNIAKLKKYINKVTPCITLHEGLERVLKWHYDHPEHIFINKTIENEMCKLMAEGLVNDNLPN